MRLRYAAAMNRIALLVLAAAVSIASADPPSSPPLKQLRTVRLSDGTPIFVELTATDAFVTFDTFRDKRHERTYLAIPLHDAMGTRLMFAEVEKAFAGKTSIGIVWSEAPDQSSPGPEWRKPEGHTYWVLQSVFNLTPDSTEPYTAPPKVLGPHGEIKK